MSSYHVSLHLTHIHRNICHSTTACSHATDTWSDHLQFPDSTCNQMDLSRLNSLSPPATRDPEALCLPYNPIQDSDTGWISRSTGPQRFPFTDQDQFTHRSDSTVTDLIPIDIHLNNTAADPTAMSPSLKNASLSKSLVRVSAAIPGQNYPKPDIRGMKPAAVKAYVHPPGSPLR